MNNVKILEQLKILDNIREVLGAKSENDTSYDEIINKMTPKQITKAWSTWYLGSSYWAEKIINIYEELKEYEVK